MEKAKPSSTGRLFYGLVRIPKLSLICPMCNTLQNSRKSAHPIRRSQKSGDTNGGIAKKFIILDIHAVDESGGEYDIEMQVRKYESYPQRTIYYACKLYADQLKSGEDYSELKPVFGIHFLDYNFFPTILNFTSDSNSDVRYPE